MVLKKKIIFAYRTQSAMLFLLNIGVGIVFFFFLQIRIIGAKREGMLDVG